MISNKLFDVAIAGGGVMGCALAYYLLKSDPALRVAIVERDSSYKRSSTVLSDGNTRIQFNIKENILMSLYGLEVMRTFAEEMATAEHTPQLNFRQQGNLFLVSAANTESALKGLALQQELGCSVEWLDPEDVVRYFPPFDPQWGEFAGATFGPCDGTFSPLDMLMGYRRKAEEMGAVVVEAGAEALLVENGRITGLSLSTGDNISAPNVANTTGAWAHLLAATGGVSLPIAPTMRQVFIIETELQPDRILPLLLLPTGEYIIHEGAGHFIVGASLEDDPITLEDFSWSRQRFEERLWENLVAFVPAFDRLKLVNGWAGLYAVNTFDGNAILGEWPDLPGLFLVNGFSGHGLQQAHAVGRYIAEMILGRPHALDLSVFSPQRLLDNQPIFENPDRLI